MVVYTYANHTEESPSSACVDTGQSHRLENGVQLIPELHMT